MNTGFLNCLNLKKACAEYRVDFWQCPQVIFVIMGLIIIASIITSHYVGERYVEPLYVVFIVVSVTIVLFILSFVVINSFERMARASKEKSEFISIMSHQLRNPLSAVKWQLDLLLASIEKNTAGMEEVKKSVISVGEHNEAMIRLLNELLDMHRLESGNLVLQPESFLLGDMVRSVVEKYTQFASSTGINIVFYPLETDIKVTADKMKLSDAVGHFLDNAVRYSPSGGKVTVSLEKIAEGRRVRCSIVDEGAGISEKDYKDIFKKFFRGEGTARYKTEGLGLGLFIAKYIIESFKGKVGFSSIEGKGSTFWFTLPVPE